MSFKMHEGNMAMDEDTLFGYSLALVDGDLVLGESDNTIIVNGVQAPTVTLLSVHGEANLQQALMLRVQTPFSSDIYNTSYGLDIREAFTQPGTLSRMKEFIKLSLVRTLATDPRVQDIRDVLFADEPRYQQQYGPVDVNATRRARSWPVVVLLDTIDTQTITLSLNIEV
jgi:hypothetical protein